MEAMAGVLAFAGVLIIARPSFLFGSRPDAADAAMFAMDHPSGLVPTVPATPTERAVAVVCAVVGTMGGATAYTTIRVIGKRAHSLVSVNYFAVLATAGSCLIILIHPDLQFEMPQTSTQW
jgi:drug/metabolite transporter (DMT)-like permease